MPALNYVLGLIGYPLGHSLSPQIHGAALHALGINGEYSLFPIPPSSESDDDLAALLNRVRNGSIQGLNVTIPHKQIVIPLIDELSPTAETIGAVNTIFLRGDVLVGDNTDAAGFWTDVQRLNKDGAWDMDRNPPSALILGAGGSARAVMYALLTHGFQITIAARRIEQAQKLCELFSDKNNTPCAVELTFLSISNLQSEPRLIVNTTPVGMHPHEDTCPWPVDIPLPKNTTIYDLVYNPRETMLVKKARTAGLPAISGIGMLVEQAALAFEHWTGLEAPRKVMRQAVGE